jgi:fucose 4-O-acetylase-like acetyltransferase
LKQNRLYTYNERSKGLAIEARMTSTADWGTADSATTAPRSLETTAHRPAFLADIERAKGLAIILVVIGHIVAREPPANNEWYVVLKTAIYAFHMPFFMYLGGLVFFHVGDAVNPRPSYGAYLIRRAERLLVPFLSLGLLILLGKFAAEQFLYVDNKPASLSDGLRSLFWTTGQSPATSVWYIFVVFVYCGVTPLLVRLSQGRLWPTLLLAVVLHCLTVPEIAYLDRVANFFVYFTIGCVAGKYRTQAMQFIDTTLPVSGVVFSVSLVLATMQVEPTVTGTICALSSLAFIHGLTRTTWLDRADALVWFGKYSFVIYLFNTLTIGLTKGVLLKVAPWDGVNFLGFFPILLMSGLIGPVLLKKVLLDRFPVLARLTR